MQVAFILAAAVLFGSPELLSGSATLQQTSEEVSTNDEHLVDLLLPMPLRQTRPFPADIEWIVTLRLRPEERPEFWAQLKKPYRGDVAIDAISVLGTPIRNQVGEAEAPSAGASEQEITHRVKYHRFAVSTRTCTSMASLTKDAEQLKLRFLPSDELLIHGTRLDIVIETRSNRESYTLTIPAAASTANPLAEWVKRVQSAVERCGRSQ